MHILSVSMKINLKLAIVFAHISIFLCVVKKSGKIGQNQENHDKIKFGPHFASKYDNCDKNASNNSTLQKTFAKYSTYAPFFAIIEI